MVLENSYNHVNDNGFNDEPLSDPDPYDAPRPSNTTLQYRIDTTNLPKPVPFIGNLLGHENKFKQEAQLKIILASKELDRPLNQDEVDAFAYWLAKRQAITSWGAPIGFAGGIWRSYNTTETFKFPFWRTSTTLLNKETFGPLRGSSAVVFLHSIRYLAYGLTGNLIGKLLFGSYAMSSAAVGASNDPRLQEYMNAVKERVREFSKIDHRSQIPENRFGSKTQKPLDDNLDDASPASINEVFPYKSQTNADNDQSNVVNPVVKTKSWTTPKPGLIPTQDYERTSPNGLETSSQTESFSTTNSGTENSNTSVWEKIRSGQHVPKSVTQKSSSQISMSRRKLDRNESSDDSFSYSKYDEESAYARDESLDNFEAQIERERRGGVS